MIFKLFKTLMLLPLCALGNEGTLSGMDPIFEYQRLAEAKFSEQWVNKNKLRRPTAREQVVLNQFRIGIIELMEKSEASWFSALVHPEAPSQQKFEQALRAMKGVPIFICLDICKSDGGAAFEKSLAAVPQAQTQNTLVSAVLIQECFLTGQGCWDNGKRIAPASGQKVLEVLRWALSLVAYRNYFGMNEADSTEKNKRLKEATQKLNRAFQASWKWFKLARKHGPWKFRLFLQLL